MDELDRAIAIEIASNVVAHTAPDDPEREFRLEFAAGLTEAANDPDRVAPWNEDEA